MSDRTQTPWWLEEGEEQAKRLCALTSSLRNDQTVRWANYELAYCLYDDASGSDLETSDFAFSWVEGEQRTPLNLVRSCCDTVRAELIQSRPRPYFLPAGADWSVRRKCQQLNKFLAGLLAEEAFDRTVSAVVLDALVFGTGVVRSLVEDGKVKLERVPPWELWCDPDEARYGEPRSLYLTRYVSREVLKAKYEDQAEAIERAQGNLGRRRRKSAELVAVVEAWHLPSAKDAGDGVHVVAIDNAVLESEAWEHDWFPFSFLRWKQPLEGFWGQGLASELVEPQRDLNRAVYAAQVGQRLNTFPRLVVQRSSGLNVEELTDEPGTVLWFNGNLPPSALTFPGVSPEIYQWIRDTIAWGYQLSGVSMAAARSEKSAGLTSGRAIQMESNLQSRRFIDAQRALEQLVVDVGRTTVRVVEHHAANDNELEVVYRGKYRAERIPWSKAKLDESSYVVRLDPVSNVPESPQGRVDQIETMISSGFAQQAGLPPQMAARALEAPDTEWLTNFISVSYDLVEEICERILDDGEEGYTTPESYFNLSVCFLVAIVTYQQWRVWSVPEDRCDVLRDWIDEVRDLLEREAGASAPSAPAASPNPAAPANDAPGGAPAMEAA